MDAPVTQYIKVLWRFVGSPSDTWFQPQVDINRDIPKRAASTKYQCSQRLMNCNNITPEYDSRLADSGKGRPLRVSSYQIHPDTIALLDLLC